MRPVETMALKTVHVAGVTTSYTLFGLRGVWTIRDLSMPQRHRVGLSRTRQSPPACRRPPPSWLNSSASAQVPAA